MSESDRDWFARQTSEFQDAMLAAARQLSDVAWTTTTAALNALLNVAHAFAVPATEETQ